MSEFPDSGNNFVPIGDVASISRGTINPSQNPLEIFNYYSIPGYDSTGGPSRTPGKEIQSNKTILEGKCVLISKLNPRIPRVCIANTTEDAKTICSTEFIPLVPRNQGIDLDYIAHYLRSPSFQEKFQAAAGGSTNSHSRVTPSEILDWEIFVPPLPEQKKIAEMLSGIDQEIIRIQQQIASLEILRTAILEQSLEQLKDCPIHPLHEITKKVTVGIVSKPADHYVSKGVPTLRSMNIKEGKIDYKDLRFISEESNQFFKKSIIREGDILTVRTGVPGTSAVAPADIDGANCVDIIISTPAEGVDSHFLCLQINSDRIKSKVLSGQGGLAQQHFNIGEMRVLDILLPSLDTQKEISSAVLSVSQCIASRCKQRSKYEGVKSAVADDLLSGRKRVSV